jgi:integrase/recombinase XerD
MIGLRPHTFATLFGLYVASGLRANEALRLDRDDVDLINGVLTIRDSKFGKTRCILPRDALCNATQNFGIAYVAPRAVPDSSSPIEEPA